MNQLSRSTTDLPLPTAAGFSNLATEIRLRAGEPLTTEGEILNAVYTVKSGRLKRFGLYKGQRYLRGLFGPGQCVGLQDLLAAGDGVEVRAHETTEAIDDVVVTVEPLDAVTAWLRQAPVAVVHALRESARVSRPERQLRKPLELLPVRARVAATLWILSEQHGRNEGGIRVLDLNLTREEVAHLAGTVYESVIRTLTSLKNEGVLDLNGRVIRVLKEDQLARIGQISIGETHVQDAISQDHSSSDNRAPQEAS